MVSYLPVNETATIRREPTAYLCLSVMMLAPLIVIAQAVIWVWSGHWPAWNLAMVLETPGIRAVFPSVASSPDVGGFPIAFVPFFLGLGGLTAAIHMPQTSAYLRRSQCCHPPEQDLEVVPDRSEGLMPCNPHHRAWRGVTK